MSFVPQQLSDEQNLALKPWRRRCAIEWCLIFTSYLALALYMIVMFSRLSLNYWVVIVWIGVNSVVWRMQMRFAKSRAERILADVVHNQDDTLRST